MQQKEYTQHYDSPLGGMFLSSDGEGLTGLWFDGQKYFASTLDRENAIDAELAVFDETKRWLDLYFKGVQPDFLPVLHPMGTPFRQRVWQSLMRIPRGGLTTYAAVSREIAAECKAGAMSAQAVGGAVGHNPVSIIIPCHRVVGSNGSLTGYAGGIDRKIALLRLEGIDTDKLSMP